MKNNLKERSDFIFEKMGGGQGKKQGLKRILLIALGISCLLYYAFWIALQHLSPDVIFGGESVSFNPLLALASMISNPVSLPVFGLVLLGVSLALWRYASYKTRFDFDSDDRFEMSGSGSAGTARMMSADELDQGLDPEHDKDKWLEWKPYEQTTGVILGLRDGRPVAQKVKQPSGALNKNILVTGIAGCGKTTAFIIPYIWQAIDKMKESVVTVDTKGDIYKETVFPAYRAGYDVKVFNVKNPRVSQGIDIMSRVGLDTELATTMAETIMKASKESGSKDESFWGESAQSLLIAIILGVNEEKVLVGKVLSGEDRSAYNVDKRLVIDREHQTREEYDYAIEHGYGTIGRVQDILIDFDGDSAFDSLCDKFDSILEYDRDGFVHPCRLHWNTFKSNSEPKVANGIIQNLAKTLGLLSNRHIRHMLTVNDIDLEGPAKRPSLYFVNIDESDSSKRMISTLFFNLLLPSLKGYADRQPSLKCDVPVNLVIDEFGAIGTIQNWPNVMATYRSREIRSVMAFQNLEQLEHNYPDDVSNITSNCGIWLAMKTNDMNTAKLFSDAIGKATVLHSSLSQSLASTQITPYTDQYSQSRSESGRELLMPDEIMRLDPDELLVRLASKSPLILKKNSHWKTGYYKDLIAQGHDSSRYKIDNHAVTLAEQLDEKGNPVTDVNGEKFYTALPGNEEKLREFFGLEKKPASREQDREDDSFEIPSRHRMSRKEQFRREREKLASMDRR